MPAHRGYAVNAGDSKKPFELEQTLQAWADTLRDTLEDLAEMSAEQAERVAREAVVRFAEDHASEQVYISKAMTYKLDSRDLEIYRRITGNNITALAREYKISPRHIRRIAKRGKVIDRIVRDDDLFGDIKLPEHY